MFATNRLLLYGEDVTVRIPPLHHDDIVRKAVSSAIFVLRELYDPASPLHVPLAYPDPQGEFYGFERDGMPAPWGWSGPGTKKLINAVSMVAMQTEHVALSRAESLPLYRRYVGDQWLGFVEQICALRTPQRGNAMPTDRTDRDQLRLLCAQMPAFMNHFLALYKAHVLVHLHSGTEVDIRWAAQALTEVRYPEPEVRQGLEELWERCTDGPLRDVVQRALHLQTSSTTPRHA